MEKIFRLFLMVIALAFLLLCPAMAQDQFCPRGQHYNDYKNKCTSCEESGLVWKDYSPPRNEPPYGFCDCGPCREETTDGCRSCYEFGLPCKNGECVRTPGNDGYFEYSREIHKGFADSMTEVQKRIEGWKMADFIIQPGQFLDRAFCYCECSDPRGVFIWAKQNGPDARNLASKLSGIAKRECEGCFKPPQVKILRENDDSINKLIPKKGTEKGRRMMEDGRSYCVDGWCCKDEATYESCSRTGGIMEDCLQKSGCEIYGE